MGMTRCAKHGLQDGGPTCGHLRTTIETGHDWRDPRLLLNGYREPTYLCPECAARAMVFIEGLPNGATHWFFDHKELDLMPACGECLTELWQHESRSLSDEVHEMRAAALAQPNTRRPPRDVVRLGTAAFQSKVCCLGVQLVGLLNALRAFRPDLTWYVADAQVNGPSPFPRREPTPTLIGDTDALIKAALSVDQFESGVFAGVPSPIDRPVFRAGGLWTEDDEDDDLGDAVVELRAFDTTYWSVATLDAGLAQAVLKQLGAESLPVDAE